MKRNHFPVALIAIVIFHSCKKNDTNPVVPGPGKSMGFLTEYAMGPGGTPVKNRYVLLDIDHTSNANKKFMTVDIVETAGNYKFQMVEGPKPITDYATNFPEGLRKIVSGYGYGHDFLASAYMWARATSGITRPYTLNYDSIHKMIPVSGVIIPINEMHNGIYAGSLTGKEPQARVEFLAPGRPDPGTSTPHLNDTLPDYFFFSQYYRVSKPARVYFYFNEGENGMYTSTISPTSRSNLFESSVFRVVSENLSGKADAAICYNGNTSVLFFFDFDKWEYMTIKFPCPTVYGAGCASNTEVSPAKSMNELMQWPADWRK